jgi:hypothetical protein
MSLLKQVIAVPIHNWLYGNTDTPEDGFVQDPWEDNVHRENENGGLKLVVPGGLYTWYENNGFTAASIT